MKRKFLCLAGLSMLLLVSVAVAADNDNHQVTVTVQAINELAVAGGDVSLTINAAVPGSEPTPVNDATTSDLAWTVNTTTKKIVAETDQVGFAHTLTVVATAVSGGTAEPSVTLSTTQTDFVSGINTTLGGCNLSYTASATAAQGVQDPGLTHLITYTIVAE